MKVNFDLQNNKQTSSKKVSFEGYKPVKNEKGDVIYEFNYPFDADKYDCYLEVCSVNTDKKNNYYIVSGLPCQTSPDGFFKLNPNGNKINMGETFNLPAGSDFAYHYALVKKGAKRTDPYTVPVYKIDAGDHIDSTKTKGRHEIYNIVTGGGPLTFTTGAMKLLMPDFYNPMWTYDNDGKIIKNPKATNSKNIIKTFSNKIGGNLAGIEKDVIDGKFDGYSRIISTPIFTDDSLSAHGYWNKNCMQMVQALGNINNYASLQREMFKKGLNFVSDGAYVNEGLEGVHFAHVLKWGSKSPFFKWFNAENLKNGPMSLGVFSANNSFIRHKVVNPKYLYTQNIHTGKVSIKSNKDYDSRKPTYIQIFDDRLVGDKFKTDNKNLINAYDIPNTKNPLEINNHNDTIIPYAFEINPETYNDNIKRLNEYNAAVKSKSPDNITDAFDTAIDIVFAKTQNSDKNAEVKDIIDKAIADVELGSQDEKYTRKVDLVLNKAVKDYGLELSSDQKTKLENTLKKLRNTISLDSYLGTRFVSKFENFELDEKIDSKFDTWDANTDIAKLKYVFSKAETQRIKLGYDQNEQQDEIKRTAANNFEVQDYAITSGRYWTKKTKNILNLYVAQKLAGIDPNNPHRAYQAILDEIGKYGTLPKKLRPEINSEIVENVLKNDYNLPRPEIPYEYKDFLLEGLMNLPLDTIEFGDNLVSVISSPYITKRATSEAQLGLSRYDMYEMRNPHLRNEYAEVYKKMDKLYTKELFDFAAEIIDNLNTTLPEDVKIYSGYNTSAYGKYVLPQLTEIITKFAMVKALAPKTSVKADSRGELTYDYDALKKVNLQTLNIYASSPEDEAVQVIGKMRSGIKKISVDDKKFLTKALFNTLKGTNESSFKLAEMITDRLNAGLDWRIDATKDIGDVNALKDEKEKLDAVWGSVTTFWKHFADNIYKENRNSYIVAEITDEAILFKNNPTKKYGSPNEMVKKFIRETNMTATANYSTYFSTILNLYGKHFDRNGRDVSAEYRMGEESKKFFEYMPFESILNSYNFIGNHDKPRALHGLILNTDWFVDNWKAKDNKYYREKAIRILDGNFLDPLLPRKNNETDEQYNRRIDMYIDGYPLNAASGKSIAMAEALQKGFEVSINRNFRDDKKAHQQVTDAIYKSLKDLANGSFQGKNFSAEAFGVKPVDVAIDIIIKQAVSQHNLQLQPKEIESLKNRTIEAVLTPGLGKLQAMMEVLAVMPGMPTLYSGDDTGTTGYESASKNMYLQNRGSIHNEWLVKPDFKFIKNHYDKMNELMALRSRPELHALNDGAPFILDAQHGTTNNGSTALSTILRQATDGSMVISLINTSGINTQFNAKYQPETVTLNEISIANNDEINPKTLTKGLTPGTIFYNANDKNDRYVVREFNGNVFIKRLVNKDNKETDDNITITGTTLTLYSKPTSNKVLYGKKFFMRPIAKNYYNTNDNSKMGKQLSIISE